MGDIEDIKHAVQRDFLIPLSEFQAHTQALDTVHDQCVQEFQKALQALFSPGVAFHGAAADAVAQLTETYLAAERAMGDYTSSSLSYRLGQAASLSQKTVAEIEPLLSSLHDFPLAQAFGVAGGAVKGAEQPVEESLPPPDPENPISLGIYVAGLAVVALGVGTTVFLASYNEQQMRANEVWQEVRQWQRGMNTLAAQPESRLPPEPTDPKPFLPTASSLGLTTQQQKTAQELFQEFGGDISLDDIENLIRQHPQWSKERLRQELLRNQLKQGTGYPGKLLRAGYTEDQILAMIRSGYTTVHMAVILGDTSLGPATTPEGRVLTKHALEDSILRHGITLQQIDDALDNYSRVRTQQDGANAYIKKNADGTYTVVIFDKSGGIVTAIKGLKPKELNAIGRRYGFDPSP